MLNIELLRTKFRSDILNIATAHKAENVRVFGSLARGTNELSSDVDFLVHFLPSASLLDMCAMENEISDILGVKVDVVADDELRPELAPFILNDAVKL
jgi:predicted nucleotidyltransferase